MKNSLSIAIVSTILLFGLLFIPLAGEIENTFVFFLGRFHPIILHLPIGALVVLFLMEIINGFRPDLNLNSACNILLWFSVFSIIPTIVLGFLLASSGNYNDEILNTHKWLGWFTALICIWLVVLRQKKSSNKPNSVTRFYKIFLLVNVSLLLFAGHYGGSLTHGANYLTKYMPTEMKTVLGVYNGDAEYLAINRVTDSTSKEALFFKNNIKPIMEIHCFKCHGENKQKGDMRLDVLNWDMINGPDAERWHSALDVINLGEMPPKKETQLKDEDRVAVVNWLSNNLKRATLAKQKDNKVVMRRLTKKQYTNSLNDLLGVNVNFGYVLPNDGKSKMGFSNNGNILQTSALHIDYYQKIAREALDKSIFHGERPRSRRYKVSLGKGIGDGVTGAEYGGYQTASISNKDLIVDILNHDGRPIRNSKNYNNDSLKVLKNKIGIGMRGSESNRYTIVNEGLILNSALPAKEVTPKSWQGPSPNLKLLVKEDFPRKGDFIFRVEASKGYISMSKERLINLRNDNPTINSSKAIYVAAKDLKNTHNLVLKNNRWLTPINVADNVWTQFYYDIPESGIYQIELIHPYVSEDEMPSYEINPLGRDRSGVISKRLHISKELKDTNEIRTPISLAYLSKGKHKGYVTGKFFVGFSHIIFTPLHEDDPLPRMLEEENDKDELKYASVNPSIQVFAGTRTDDGVDYKTFGKSKEVNIPLGEHQTFEFKGRLENLPIPLESSNVSGELANILTVGVWNNHLVKESSLNGPPLLIKSVEFEAPYYPIWPPESHTNIFFDSPNKANIETYTEEILSRFIQNAFRRSLNSGELNRYMDFWRSIKEDFERYEDGVKEVLVAVLCSPNFIYLFEPETDESKKSRDEFYLASQLSYFLWNSPPDETLTTLASIGDLYNQLPEQIDRMVNSPKITQMVNSFAFEWLRLDRHKSMDTDVEAYEDFTRFVKEDMFKETYSFVHHVLKNDMSIMNFIDSDFAMLNQNLAEFYGIEGVKGNAFRPVDLSENDKRGGLLSQGSFLSGHSDGVQAHPIKRAVWLKEKILGDHPPPPPANVPELDPETPGFENLTLKEQLFLHRNKTSCLDCHHKIDPFGVVFENYDAVGRYQLTAKEKPIDSKSKLPDGTEVDGIEGIKDYILELKKEDFTRSLVENLFAYAVGRDVGFADEEEINNIVAEVINNDFRFKTVIEQIVLSPSFYKKEQTWYNKIFGI